MSDESAIQWWQEIGQAEELDEAAEYAAEQIETAKCEQQEDIGANHG